MVLMITIFIFSLISSFPGEASRVTPSLAPYLAPNAQPTSSPSTNPLSPHASSPAPTSFISSAPNASPSFAQYSSPTLQPEPSSFADSLSPRLSKDSGIQDIEDFLEKDIKTIEEQYQWLMKADQYPESMPSGSNIPSTCIKQRAQDYAVVLNDLKNAVDDLVGGEFVSADEDISAIDLNITSCDECLKEMVQGNCPLKDSNEKLKKHALHALVALQFTS